jgi:hypothetical protein
LENKGSVASGKVLSRGDRPIAGLAKDMRYFGLLGMSDLNGDPRAGFETSIRSSGNDAIGIETIFAAIQGAGRIEVTHFRLQDLKLFGRYIGRI